MRASLHKVKKIYSSLYVHLTFSAPQASFIHHIKPQQSPSNLSQQPPSSINTLASHKVPPLTGLIQALKVEHT